MLLLVEPQNELLLKNHGERPTGTLPMQNHATHVPTTRFVSKGSKRISKSEKEVGYHCRRQLNEHTNDPIHNIHKRIIFQNFHPHNWFFKILVRALSVGPQAKNCKTTSHLVKLYKEHGERHDTHAIYVKHMETPYEETVTDPFGDMKSHTISGDTEPNIFNTSLLVYSATTDTILRDNKYFLYLGPMMTKHIAIVIGSHLISYQIGEACLVIPGGTYIRISRAVYLPTSTRNLLSF